MKHKILLGLTTTSASDWRAKIEEARKFNITEVALFPTTLDPEERKELYNLLESSPIKRIPHVHLRHDFTITEIDYLSERYQTQLFNMHADENGKIAFVSFQKYCNKIYFENQKNIKDLFRELIDISAGICIDFAHWKDNYEYRGILDYKNFPQILSTHKIGCCHISALRESPIYDEGDQVWYHAWHKAEGTQDLKYMSEFLDYLPEYCSLELENTFEEQFQYKKFLEEMVATKIISMKVVK